MARMPTDEQLRWLAKHTIVQADGSLDPSRPRSRVAGVDVDPREVALLSVSTPRPPRVWPVFLLYVGVLGWLLVTGALMLTVAVLRSQPHLAEDRDALAAAIEEASKQPSMLVLSVIVSSSTLSLVGWLYMRRGLTEAERPGWARKSVLSLFVAVVVGLCISQVVGAGVHMARDLAESTSLEVINEAVARASPGAFVAIVVGFVAAAIGEELFFRGAMQSRLKARWGPRRAILVTAVLFGLLHFDPLHAAFAVLFGLYLGWTVERAGSLVPALAIHGFNNLIAGLSARWAEGETEPSAYVLAAYAAVGAVGFATVGKLWPGASLRRSVQPSRPAS